MALQLAFTLACLESLALAAVLRVWARSLPGSGLLQCFLVGVAVWAAGNQLPNWFGLEAIPLGMALLATAPFSAAAFLHFCLRLCGRPERRWLLATAYGAGVGVFGLCLAVDAGHFAPAVGVRWAPVPNWAGWTASWTWGLLSAGGMGVLADTLRRRPPPALRRPVAAVALSCGWGLLCMLGYGGPALGLPWYPWPLLGLPLYPLMLVYGILRYRVFVTNARARRALAWALLLTLGLLVVPLTVWLPLESRWLGGALIAATCLALNGPVRRFAERLVYPGGSPSAADLASWREALASADSLPALAEQAGRLLGAHLGLVIEVTVGEAALPEAARPAHTPLPAEDPPRLHCGLQQGRWLTRLEGWEAAPPGPRQAAELFGGLLAEAAAQVQRLQQAAERERERERERAMQARLAELGALSATVAHDLRNPLHIIGMAMALAPPALRREVGEQTERLARLADDLLDYARPWQLQPAPLDLGEAVREAARRWPGTTLGPGCAQAWPLQADAHRLQQVLHNLLANAHGGPPGQPAAHAVQIEVEAAPATPIDPSTAGAPPGGTRLRVCDQGPGVPDELRERLFQPFASRSPGGTGLGLAIVARILAAHGGTVALVEHPPWRTCFQLQFPAGPPAAPLWPAPSPTAPITP